MHEMAVSFSKVACSIAPSPGSLAAKEAEVGNQNIQNISLEWPAACQVSHEQSMISHESSTFIKFNTSKGTKKIQKTIPKKIFLFIFFCGFFFVFFFGFFIDLFF
jgi:hypothetical protein